MTTEPKTIDLDFIQHDKYQAALDLFENLGSKIGKSIEFDSLPHPDWTPSYIFQITSQSPPPSTMNPQSPTSLKHQVQNAETRDELLTFLSQKS